MAARFLRHRCGRDESSISDPRPFESCMILVRRGEENLQRTRGIKLKVSRRALPAPHVPSQRPTRARTIAAANRDIPGFAGVTTQVDGIAWSQEVLFGADISLPIEPR